jgi:hypothetical protein
MKRTPRLLALGLGLGVGIAIAGCSTTLGAPRTALLQASAELDGPDQQAQAVGNLAPAFQAPSQAALAVQQLQASVPSIELVADLSSATDPDGLLGLPGQYTSKAQFSDSSNPACPDANQPACFVEVFDSPSALASRAKALHGEADLSNGSQGTVLVRVLGVASAPTDYRGALSTLVLP